MRLMLIDHDAEIAFQRDTKLSPLIPQKGDLKGMTMARILEMKE